MGFKQIEEIRRKWIIIWT